MKNRPALFFASIFVILLLTLLVTFNHQKPRVLILHSFPDDGSWESAVNTGIQRELARNRRPIAVRWRSMLFSHQISTQQWTASSQRTRGEIDSWQPHVLVTIGEEAQDYVGRHYAGQPGPRLVYVMGEDPASFDYSPAANVTGIREVLPLAQIVELLQHLNRPTLRIRALGIDDLTGHAERQQVRSFDWGPHQLLGVQLVSDLQAWQAAVDDAGHDSDILLVLSFAGLRETAESMREVNSHSVAAWTESHSKPLAISVRQSFVEAGGALAVVPSPHGLGEQAARKALDVLATIRRAVPMPPSEDSIEVQIALRPARLAARGVKLPSIYTQAARAAQSLYTGPPKMGG